MMTEATTTCLTSTKRMTLGFNQHFSLCEFLLCECGWNIRIEWHGANKDIMKKNYMKRGSDIHKMVEVFLRSRRMCRRSDCVLLKNIELTLNKYKWKFIEAETMHAHSDVWGRIDAIFQRGSHIILVDWKVTTQGIKQGQYIDEKFDAFHGRDIALYTLQMNLYDFIYNPQQQQPTELYIGNIVGNKVNMIKCQKFTRSFIERIIYNYIRQGSK